MSVRIKEKVVKLLRLAQDRQGLPEGDLAQRMADKLIEAHDIDITEDDVAFEGPREVIQHCVGEQEERQWWMEMLLVTLCDHYDIEAVIMVSPHGWRLYLVVEPEDDVDVEDVEQHFHYLCELVNDLRDASASEFMRASPSERDNAISSFCIGAVLRISQLLYKEDRDLETMPFMFNALGAAPEEELSSADKGYNSDTSTVSLSLQAAPQNDRIDAYNDSGHDAEPKVIEIIPDWSWFNCGYEAARNLIRQVNPPSTPSDCT